MTRRMNKVCSRLMVDGEVVSDPQLLMEAWLHHFGNLDIKSQIDDCPELLLLQKRIETLASQSLENGEYFLDVPFVDEEVGNAVRRLKKRWAPGLIILWLNTCLNGVTVLLRG